jgi:hypothetical protein
MSFLRPLRTPSVLLRTPRTHRLRPRPSTIAPTTVRFASGYGDPSDNAHPATADPQAQGNSAQKAQAEHPGPRENEPDSKGGSTFGDKGQEKGSPTDTKSASRASETSWDNGGNGSGKNGGSASDAARVGSKVHGKDRTETALGGNLSGNKDKMTDENTTAGVSRVKGDLNVMGQVDGKDARDVGGKDDTRKQS